MIYKYKRQLTWLLHENTCQKSFFRIVQSELQSLEFFLPLTLKHIIALELELFYCNVEQEVGEGQESLIKFTDELVVFFSKWEQARDFFTFFSSLYRKSKYFFVQLHSLEQSIFMYNVHIVLLNRIIHKVFNSPNIFVRLAYGNNREFYICTLVYFKSEKSVIQGRQSCT